SAPHLRPYVPPEPLAARQPLFAIRSSPFAIRHSLFAIRYSPPSAVRARRATHAKKHCAGRDQTAPPPGRNRVTSQGTAFSASAAALAVPPRAERLAAARAAGRWLWSCALMVALAFLVLYPVAMLLIGALTNANPVTDGFGVRDLSIANFITVLANPNVHAALANSLIACGGGTALAVVIGLMFSWVVVRTNTPCKRFIAAVSI